MYSCSVFRFLSLKLMSIDTAARVQQIVAAVRIAKLHSFGFSWSDIVSEKCVCCHWLYSLMLLRTSNRSAAQSP